MLPTPLLQAFADDLLRAEAESSPIAPLSERHPEATLEDARKISSLVAEAKIAAGTPVEGHKIGYTSKAMREMVGATEPDYGYLYADRFVDEGSILNRSDLNRPKVEVEIAFVLAEDLSGPRVNAVDVIRATDFILPAFELLDMRCTHYGEKRLIDSVADQAGCGSIMIGGNPIRLTDIDIRRISCSLVKNGAVEVSGTAAAVMGSPINAIAWLARKLHETDTPLRAGHTVLSGSFTRAVDIDAGDSFSADYGELGVITFGVR